MDWLLLAALGIMWLAFLLPSDRRRHSAAQSVEDFERRMELLAQVETHGGPGRWIVTPRKGVRFMGAAQRQRARTRERRRKVFAFLLESIGLSFLIGLVPPLHVIWALTAALVSLLVVYVAMLLTIKNRAVLPPEIVRAARPPAKPSRPAAVRYVAGGISAWARPTLGGLGSLVESEGVHVVVRPASDMAGA